MPCEHHKDALIEAAATGAAPQSELQAQLASCASCRAAFAQELSILAAIDAGLHIAANTEVPPSLLPRVRARLDQLPVASRLRWLQPLGFASVSVVLALLIFLIVGPHRIPPVEQARQIPVRPAPMTSTTSPNPDKASPEGNQIASMRARNSTILHSAASSNPEVLVPPDEREAFGRFMSRNAAEASATVASAPKPPMEFVEVFPVEIMALKVKPLDQDNNQQAEF